MKKNITINLCGRLFQIDEDAYEMLQHYIDSLRHSFGKQEGGDEIVDDIETRIAELFDELRQQGIEAITIEHVKDIITRIGKPEELTDEEKDEEKQKSETNWEDRARSTAQSFCDNVRQRTAGKKYFRNPKDKMLAGVLSGFATYTNTDPVIWRLLMILFTFFYGVGIIIYLVLAIVLPEARTPEQFLQMEGKEVTPKNLAEVVLDNNNQETAQPGLLRTLFSIVLKIVFSFFVAISLIVGLALGIGLISMLVVLICVLVFPISSAMPFSLSELGLLEAYNANPLLLLFFTIALFALFLIPVYAIIHMVLSLSKRVKPMGMGQRIMWIVLWIVALCCVIPSGIVIADYSKHNSNWEKAGDDNFTYQGVEMSIVDADFLRQGSWDVLKADDCDHFTWSGIHPSGDPTMRYLDVYDDDCEAVVRLERKQEVMPGVYRLECQVRSEGPGAYIYIKGKEMHLTEIPVNGSNRHKKDNWSSVTLDSIVCTDSIIAYGMTSDLLITHHPCRSKWFSATDFTLTRTGDLPKEKTKKK